MLLAVDIGNSHTSFGVFEGSTLKREWRSETKHSRTPDEYAAFLFPLFQHAGLAATGWEVSVCSVVPSANTAVAAFSRSYLDAEPFFINWKSETGCTLGIDFPEEVGADRLANAAYAARHFKLPAVVVDLGTATTFDVISKNRVYSGGAILPGVRLAVEALGTKTSKLPIIELKMPEKVIGTNTIDCIRSGVLLGYCALIDGLLDRMEAELGSPFETALTGGFSELLHPALRRRGKLLPNLTLEGTEILYRLNRPV